jgi:hypothetical protein
VLVRKEALGFAAQMARVGGYLGSRIGGPEVSSSLKQRLLPVVDELLVYSLDARRMQLDL